MRSVVTGLLLLLFLFMLSCSSQEHVEDHAFNQGSDKITIYYFHGNRRCATCLAVEDIAKNIVDDRYRNSEEVQFLDINISESENKKLAEKFKVASSGLYIFNGATYEDITFFAFQYAREEPERVRDKIIELVEKALN